MKTNKTSFSIQEALDWELEQGQTLRQALVDAAEEILDVKDKEGSISIEVTSNGEFWATFTEA